MILNIPFTDEEEKRIKGIQQDGSLAEELKDYLLKKYSNFNDIDVKEIKLFLTDCDGCLTDGGMYYTENGDEIKKFNTRDGWGMRALQEKGIKVGILTGEDRALNKRRSEKMKVDYIFQGIADKPSKINEICQELNITTENIAYVGDDKNDLAVMKMVGLSFAPADATWQAKDAATVLLQTPGGRGAIREAAERILNNL